MHRPHPGELLRGVHRALEESVLPELQDGAPQRQLKASLHILRRLERSWDRMPAYLAADNADLHATLARVAEQLDDAPLRAALAGLDPAAAEPAAVNDRLQALVAETDAAVRAGDLDPNLRSAVLAVLGELYRRMLDREAHAWGTTS